MGEAVKTPLPVAVANFDGLGWVKSAPNARQFEWVCRIQIGQSVVTLRVPVEGEMQDDYTFVLEQK